MLTRFCAVPTVFTHYWTIRAAHKLLAEPVPHDLEWTWSGNPWNANKSYKWFKGVASVGILLGAGNDMNPFYTWNSTAEQVLWVFVWVHHVSFMFYGTPFIITVDDRVVQFFEAASNELDDALNDTEDAVEVAKACRARVFARTTTFLNQATPVLNAAMLDCLVSTSTAAIATFQDRTFVSIFVWYAMVTAFVLWKLSAVNARYIWFTRGLHELTKPNVRARSSSHFLRSERVAHHRARYSDHSAGVHTIPWHRCYPTDRQLAGVAWRFRSRGVFLKQVYTV